MRDERWRGTERAGPEAPWSAAGLQVSPTHTVPLPRRRLLPGEDPVRVLLRDPSMVLDMKVRGI